MMILMSPESCEYTDDLSLDRQILYMSAGACKDSVEACLCRGRSFLVIDIDRGRTCQQVSVNRRRYKDALAVSRRLREDGLRNEAAHLLVHDVIIAASRCDVDLVFRNHVVEMVGVYAGCVDDASGLVLTVVCADMPDALIIFFKFLNFRIKTEINAVLIGVFRKSDRQTERADNAGRRCIKCALRIVGKVRLHGKRLFAAEDLHSLYAVGNTSVIEVLQAVECIFVNADNKRAVSLERHIQFLCNLVHHFIAAHIHLRHHGSGHTVIARMYDGRIGF